MTEPPQKGRHPSQYLNDLEEWGENQYNPGHFTGGKIPPYYKYARRPVVIVVLIIGLYTAVSSLVVLTTSAGHLSNLLPGGVGLVAGFVLVAGSLVRLLRKPSPHRASRRRKHH